MTDQIWKACRVCCHYQRCVKVVLSGRNFPNIQLGIPCAKECDITILTYMSTKCVSNCRKITLLVKIKSNFNYIYLAWDGWICNKKRWYKVFDQAKEVDWIREKRQSSLTWNLWRGSFITITHVRRNYKLAFFTFTHSEQRYKYKNHLSFSWGQEHVTSLKDCKILIMKICTLIFNLQFKSLCAVL